MSLILLYSTKTLKNISKKNNEKHILLLLWKNAAHEQNACCAHFQTLKRRRKKNFSTNFYHVRYISFMWFQHFNKILVRQKNNCLYCKKWNIYKWQTEIRLELNFDIQTSSEDSSESPNSTLSSTSVPLLCIWHIKKTNTAKAIIAWKRNQYNFIQRKSFKINDFFLS